MSSSQSTTSKTPSPRSSGTDTKSSASSATPASPQIVPEENTFQAWQEELQVCMKKLSERSPDLANLAKVERERDEALSQLKSKTTELEGRKKDVRYLNRTRKVYLDDYTDKYKAWEDEKAELKRSFDKERERMLTDHKDASVQTQQQLDSLKHSYDGLQKEHRHTVDEAQLVKSKLDVATRELAQSQAYTSHLGQLETESLPEKICGLWETSLEIVRDCFEELPANVLDEKNHDAWETGVPGLCLTFNFPPDNAAAVRFVRVGVVLHTIWSEIVNTVFKPCYCFTSEEVGVVQHVLDRSFSTDRRKRELVHALLLSTHSREETSTRMHDLAASARDTVVGKLAFMCSDAGLSFRDRIEPVFEEACKLWLETQYSAQEVKALTLEDIPFAFSDWEWEVWGGHSAFMQPAAKCLMVFPAFYCQDSVMALHNGLVIREDQMDVKVANAAWNSFRGTRSSKNSRGHTGRNSSGRQSISIRGHSLLTSPMSSPKEFRVQAPLSPKALNV